MTTNFVDGGAWGIGEIENLQLARGIYQASRIRPSFNPDPDECPYYLREPWLHARGREPAFNLRADVDGSGLTSGDDTERLAREWYPNLLHAYPYTELELEGGRLTVGFERSATWPRQPFVYTQRGDNLARSHGAYAGTVLAEGVYDEYGNRVAFERVPDYGWETDYKVPPQTTVLKLEDPNFSKLPAFY